MFFSYSTIMTSNETQLLTLFFKNKLLNFKKGDIILSPYDTSPSIFYLEKGYVKHYALTENGEERCYIFYKPGQIFSFLPKTYTLEKDNFFVAMTPAQVRKTTLKALNEFLIINPEATSLFIDNFFDTLGTLISRIDNLEIIDAHNRLINRLLYLSTCFGEKHGKKTTITIPITHKDLANTINMTRETVSREMGALKKKKIVIYKGHLITCLNEKLQNQIKH